MTRYLGVYVVALLLLIAPSFANAQDNPILAKLLARKIKARLLSANSPESGFRDGPHWLHFDDPLKNLVVTLNVEKKKRLELSGRINAKVVFNFHAVKSKKIFGRSITIFRRDLGGTADAVLAFDASAIGGDRLSDAKVKITEIKFNNLRMKSTAARPFNGLIESFVNRALNGKKKDFEGKLVGAVNSFDYSITGLAKKTVIELTKGEEFRVDTNDPKFSGTIAFVDPEKNMKVVVKDFDIKSDAVSFNQQSTTKLHIVGDLKEGDLTIPLDFESNVIVTVKGESQLAVSKGKFVLHSKVETADARMAVTKLNKPKGVPGGTNFASTVLTSVVNGKMDEIVKTVNAHIATTPFNP